MTGRGLWKMLATMAAFGLALPLMGCSDNGHLGNTLNFSGQVYTLIVEFDEMETITFTPFTRSQPITSNLTGVTGAITNGRLSFQAGRPSNLGPLDDIWMFDGATINPSSARGIELEMLRSNTGMNRGNASGNRMSNTWNIVMHVFVDREVTISRGAETNVWGDFSNTTNAFNITLREGWNAVHVNEVSTETSGTETISLGNPGNLRWVSK